MGHNVAAYIIRGRRVPSVTEILKLAGLIDYSVVDPEVLEAAAIRGQETHEWCELLDRGEDTAPSDPRVQARVEAYRKFLHEASFEPTAIEEPVLNATYLYAGTPDRAGTLNGRDVVLDLKPPGQAEPWWGLQLAGYAACMKGPPDRFTLQLYDDGTYRLSEFKDRNDFHVFLSATRVVHWGLENGWKLEG